MVTTPTSSYMTSNISTTLSTNTTTAPPLSEDVLNIFTIIFCLVILVVGLLGNLLVLLVFGMRYKKLKTCEMFMVSLAVADLIGSIVVPSKTLMEVMEQSFHPVGHAGCKIISLFSMTSLTVSALTLLIISADRFIIVKWPLRERTRFSTICYVIVTTWIIGGTFGSVYVFGDRMQLYAYSNDIHYCRDMGSLKERKIHVLLAMSAQIIIPLIFISLFYTMIIHELQKGIKNALFQSNEREVRERMRRNHKASRLLIAIVVVFYVCVIPINVFYLLYMFMQLSHLSHRQIIHSFTLLSMLQMVNSCANPVIYSKLHTSFRRTTLRLLCSCCFKKFKGYRWGSLGESFRYALTTTMSMRSKRSSRGSIASTKDSIFRRKSFQDDYNHNKKLCDLKRVADFSGRSSPVTSIRVMSTCEEPLLCKQSSNDDDVFSSLTNISNGRNNKITGGKILSPLSPNRAKGNTTWYWPSPQEDRQRISSSAQHNGRYLTTSTLSSQSNELLLRNLTSASDNGSCSSLTKPSNSSDKMKEVAL